MNELNKQMIQSAKPGEDMGAVAAGAEEGRTPGDTDAAEQAAHIAEALDFSEGRDTPGGPSSEQAAVPTAPVAAPAAQPATPGEAAPAAVPGQPAQPAPVTPELTPEQAELVALRQQNLAYKTALEQTAGMVQVQGATPQPARQLAHEPMVPNQATLQEQQALQAQQQHQQVHPQTSVPQLPDAGIPADLLPGAPMDLVTEDIMARMAEGDVDAANEFYTNLVRVAREGVIKAVPVISRAAARSEINDYSVVQNFFDLNEDMKTIRGYHYTKVVELEQNPQFAGASPAVIFDAAAAQIRQEFGWPEPPKVADRRQQTAGGQQQMGQPVQVGQPVAQTPAFAAQPGSVQRSAPSGPIIPVAAPGVEPGDHDHPDQLEGIEESLDFAATQGAGMFGQ